MTDTAKSIGKATVTAKGNGYSDSVELNVVATPTKSENIQKRRVDYKRNPLSEVGNLQKLVARYPHGSAEIPVFVSSVKDYGDYQKAVTADGAVWEIKEYGVLRTDVNAPTQRDVEQRFMGDRYFYSADTTDGKVLAIFIQMTRLQVRFLPFFPTENTEYGPLWKAVLLTFR